jgi:hypothetical protein
MASAGRVVVVKSAVSTASWKTLVKDQAGQAEAPPAES